MQKRTNLVGSITWVILLLTLSATGCATLTNSQIEDRIYIRAEYQSQFLDFRAACWKQNRRIFIDARNIPPTLGIPHYGDRYYCY